MRILIDNRSGLPIYDQIYSQIKAQIISGDLKEDEPLPSIRNLAKDLRISVVTTKRAYDELEKVGYICTVAGKGSYVNEKNCQVLREAQLLQLERHLQEALRLAPACGLSTEEVIDLIRMLEKE